MNDYYSELYSSDIADLRLDDINNRPDGYDDYKEEQPEKRSPEVVPNVPF